MIALDKAVGAELLGLLNIFADQVMSGRKPTETIDRAGSPYIERWMLARKATIPSFVAPYAGTQGESIPSDLENLYLHRYGRADADEPHCHPWPNGTVVVRGWYDEEVYDDGELVGTFRRYPGSVVLRQSHEIHAITAIAVGTVSLFATLRKEREWGFHTDDGLIPWHEFGAWKAAREQAA